MVVQTSLQDPNFNAESFPYGMPHSLTENVRREVDAKSDVKDFSTEARL